MNTRHLQAGSRPPIILPTGVYVLAFRVLSRGYGLLAAALGAALLVGGPARFSGRGFAAAASVPGAQVTWGTIAAVGGVATLATSLQRRPRPLVSAVSVLVCWHAFFAVSIAVSAYRDPRAGLTGPVVYAGLAGLGIVLAAALREASR